MDELNQPLKDIQNIVNVQEPSFSWLLRMTVAAVFVLPLIMLYSYTILGRNVLSAPSLACGMATNKKRQPLRAAFLANPINCCLLQIYL